MSLSLAKLRHLATVAEEKSISRAAEVLGISQPALSRSIAAVEERYGVKVFERGRSGAELTAAGVPIVNEVQALLRNIETLDQNLVQYGRGNLGSLSFGISPQLGSFLLKTISLTIFRENPDVQLQAVIRSAPELAEALLRNEIEFFICIDSQLSDHPEMEVDLICQSAAVFCVRAGHPLAGKERVTLNDMRAFPFASPIRVASRGSGYRDANLTCDNYHILRDVVEESDMVFACTPSFIRGEIEAGRLHVLDIADRPLQGRPTFIARRRGRNISPIASFVMNATRAALLDES